MFFHCFSFATTQKNYNGPRARFRPIKKTHFDHVSNACKT